MKTKSNKVYILIILCAMLVPFFGMSAQDFGIKFSGYVKTDFFYDTRQNSMIREGHFLLFPLGRNYDANKVDINDTDAFNFLSIQTRLTGKITAPDAFGAKASGVIEADFFGNENAGFVDANGFRLRHAIVKLNWTSTELMAGQYWHPFFIPECFSDVISFNTGAPFQPFSRNPQLRLTQKVGDFKLIAAVLAQRDFTSPAGSTSLRYSAMPEADLGLQYGSINETAKTEFLCGLGGSYKTLKPLLNTEKAGKTYVTDETVSGMAAQAFLKYKNSWLTYKLQGVYGQNVFDMLMLGGYAIKEISDTLKNTVTYAPLNTLSAWTELMVNSGELVTYALWAGYTENLGSDDKLLFYTDKVGGTTPTVRGADIKSIIRISPRVVFHSGKLDFAFETEFTSAAYALKDNNGKLMRDEYGKVTDTENINNIRFLLSAIFKF